MGTFSERCQSLLDDLVVRTSAGAMWKSTLMLVEELVFVRAEYGTPPIYVLMIQQNIIQVGSLHIHDLPFILFENVLESRELALEVACATKKLLTNWVSLCLQSIFRQSQPFIRVLIPRASLDGVKF